MKKQILKVCTIAALSLTISNVSYGQAFVPAGGTGPDLETDGSTQNVIIHNNLGIGTTNMSERLNINGNITFDDPINPAPYDRDIIGKTVGGSLRLFSDNDFSDGSGISLNSSSNINNQGHILYQSLDNSGIPPTSAAHSFTFEDGANPTNNLMTLYKDGTVGVGTDPMVTPDGNFFVEGWIGLSGSLFYETSTSGRQFYGNSDNDLTLFARTGWDDGSGIYMSATNNTTYHGGIVFVSTEHINTGDPYELAYSFRTATTSGGNWNDPIVSIFKNGHVSIGQNTQAHDPDYKLFVKDGILTEKLKVAVHASAAWSDYVFEDDYELKSLDQVDSYIKENKHLPDVPSAKEVVKDGIDMATMDATLLRKIEELTLYVIQQQKEIEALKSRLDK